MRDLTVKRCSNEKCVRKHRIYLNGQTICELCGAELRVSTMRMDPEMLDTLYEMEQIKSGVNLLLKKK